MADLGVSGADNLLLERSIYIGDFLYGILYGESPHPSGNVSFRSHLTQSDAGLEIFVFFAAIHCISNRPPDYRKRQTFYLVYGGILLALATINVTVSAVWGQYMWIDHRNHPGGPLGLYAVTQGAWYNILRFAANSTGNILSDGLLVRPISPGKAAQME